MLAFKILLAGKKAITEIEGLGSLLFRGIFINYLIFICLNLTLNILFFFKFISPIISWIFGHGEGFWATLGNTVLWSIQLTFAAIITLISLRFSVELLYLWNQCLVKKIILYFRKKDDKLPSLKYLWEEIKYFFVEAIKACIFPIIMLFFGLIPLIGLPVVFLLESHLLGRQSVMIYLESLTDTKEIAELKKKWRFMPVRIGWLATILTFIPIIGWLFLPLTLTYQVIGFAYTMEKSRKP